jgi:hypothetical protein
VVQEPAVRVRRVGVLAGGDTGEVCCRQRPATQVRGGDPGGTSVGAADGRRDSTLLGPERTTGGPGGSGWSFGARHDLVSYTVRDEPAEVFVVFLGVWWGTVGLWVGRWLRIAQWTRASCFLWLSCSGRTVDALVPGADEGRGRPR